MEKASSYTLEREIKYTNKLREICAELPGFCGEFFRGIADQTAILTRYNYAVDLRIFFRYLCDVKYEGVRDVRSLTLNDLQSVTLDDLEQYMEFLNLYESPDGRSVKNKERAKARKVASLRSLFKYFYRKQKLQNNVASLLETPKIHQKPILRLEADEVANVLDQADQLSNMTARQQCYNQHTHTRDVAILTLFLGTGIRVSELVGLNMDDLDFSTNGFTVTRKGGDRVILYFSEEVASALHAYLAERTEIDALPGQEKALFLSMQRRRITVRAVENIVKKYTKPVVPLKNITPHKLRSTFGTQMYQETGDIYLVADVLGHKDVNTTTKHYAAQADARRRQAARTIKLRED